MYDFEAVQKLVEAAETAAAAFAIYEEHADDAWSALADLADETAGSVTENGLWVGVIFYPDGAILLTEDEQGFRAAEIVTEDEARAEILAVDTECEDITNA